MSGRSIVAIKGPIIQLSLQEERIKK